MRNEVLKVDNIEKYYGNKSNITKAINNIFFREVFGTINYKVGFIISLVIGMNVYIILTFKILSKKNKTI